MQSADDEPPDAASFDPIFWLFHANWDRLWWQWQQTMDAKTVATFRSTIKGSADFLAPPFKIFGRSTRRPTKRSTWPRWGSPTPNRPSRRSRPSLRFAGTVRAASPPFTEFTFRIETPRASVRLKGIDRLAIPGSFRAVLRGDAEVIGRRAFFQSTEPVECARCRERAKINLDFLVEVDQALGKTLTASIEVVTPDPGLGAAIPLSACGNPTLNVRLLVEQS